VIVTHNMQQAARRGRIHRVLPAGKLIEFDVLRDLQAAQKEGNGRLHHGAIG